MMADTGVHVSICTVTACTLSFPTSCRACCEFLLPSWRPPVIFAAISMSCCCAGSPTCSYTLLRLVTHIPLYPEVGRKHMVALNICLQRGQVCRFCMAGQPLDPCQLPLHHGTKCLAFIRRTPLQAARHIHDVDQAHPIPCRRSTHNAAVQLSARCRYACSHMLSCSSRDRCAAGSRQRMHSAPTASSCCRERPLAAGGGGALKARDVTAAVEAVVASTGSWLRSSRSQASSMPSARPANSTPARRPAVACLASCVFVQ